MRYCFFLFFTFLLVGSFFASGQSTGKDSAWLKKITANAISNPEKSGTFLQAAPGYALYFSKAGPLNVPYLVYVPRGYNPARPVSMVVFLHGAILARDSFQYKNAEVADEPIFSVADTFNTIVVFPFGKRDFVWSHQLAAFENVLEVTRQVEERYNVNKARVYLGGISMGGIATFWFISNKPELFAGFYTFSAIPNPVQGPVNFTRITNARPLYSMNATDDQVFAYEDVYQTYQQHRKDAPGWHFYSVESGGHRFIYNPKDRHYVAMLLANLLAPKK